MKDKTEKFIDGMIEFIKKLDDKDRAFIAEEICFNAALYGGYNYYEGIGILDEAKAILREAEKSCVCDECREEEEKKKNMN